MSIDYCKCEICGENFPDVEFYESTEKDENICEKCLQRIQNGYLECFMEMIGRPQGKTRGLIDTHSDLPLRFLEEV